MQYRPTRTVSETFSFASLQLQSSDSENPIVAAHAVYLGPAPQPVGSWERVGGGWTPHQRCDFEPPLPKPTLQGLFFMAFIQTLPVWQWHAAPPCTSSVLCRNILRIVSLVIVYTHSVYADCRHSQVLWRASNLRLTQNLDFDEFVTFLLPRTSITAVKASRAYPNVINDYGHLQHVVENIHWWLVWCWVEQFLISTATFS